jgi:serine/threonine protein kinase
MAAMREYVHVEPNYRDLLSFIDGEAPFKNTCEFFGLRQGQTARSTVVRKELVDKNGEVVAVYFKLYGYRRLKRRVARLLKPTRSKSEFNNLKFFHELGIAVGTPMAQGESRDAFGMARNCLLITKEVVGSQQLDLFIEDLEAHESDEVLKNDLKRQITESLAGDLRKIHDRNFFHKDLKPRNVLVRRVGDRGERIEMFWIDCPSGYFDRTGGFRRKHGVIKDVATLDHFACKNYSDEERMYFISCYTGENLGDPKLAEFGRKVVEYRKRKLDD